MHRKKRKFERFEDTCPGLAVFTFLLACATLLDLNKDIALLTDFSTFSPISLLGLAFVFLPVWTILKPSSLLRSIPFFVFLLVAIIVRMQSVPNHTFVLSFILITILVCLIYSKIKEKGNFTKNKFYELFAPVLRLELIIIYFWAAFHKINTGFLDYKISCATVELFIIKDIIPSFPTPDWFIYINPYLTISIEALIPILLIIPKTRIYGLILGFCFHFFLGFKYPGFTVLVYSLYALFIPPSSYDRIKTRVGRLKDRISGAFPRISNYKHWKKRKFVNFITNVVLILLIFFTLHVFLTGSHKTSFLFSREGLYLIFCILLGIAFVYFIAIRAKELRIDERMIFIPQKKWLLIFPAIIFINGIFPHIGLKNIQVLAMFSNLQTEGGKTNHLLIPSSFQIFNNLEDLVSIKGSNNKTLNQLSGYVSKRTEGMTTILTPKSYVDYMRDKNEDFRTTFKYKIPFVKLQNIVTQLANKGVRNIELEYERGGEVFYTKNAELDPLLNNASIFQIKFLSQRAVPDDERGLCMW